MPISHPARQPINHPARAQTPNAPASARAVVPVRRSSPFSDTAATRTSRGAPSAVVPAAITLFNSATFDFCSSVIIANLLARLRACEGSPDTGGHVRTGNGEDLQLIDEERGQRCI